MKKIRIIENGVLSHPEMNLIQGGLEKKCTNYTCTIHGRSNCFAKYSICGWGYNSCTGPELSNKTNCEKKYSGPTGKGGLIGDFGDFDL